MLEKLKGKKNKKEENLEKEKLDKKEEKQEEKAEEIKEEVKEEKENTIEIVEGETSSDEFSNDIINTEGNIEVVDELPEDGQDEITLGGMEGIKISNEAIATYAGIAIAEVPGVYSMDGTFVEALRGRKSVTKGIKVEADEKTAKIDVNIIVEYGARIPEVAFEIQTRVKKSVEAMTGLKVLEVNVHVNGVQKH